MPSNGPSQVPSKVPSDVPSDEPSDVPSDLPSDVPSDLPSTSPSSSPSAGPSDRPTLVFSSPPSSSPSILLFAGLTYAEWKGYRPSETENYLNTLTSDDCEGVIDFIALEDCCAPYPSNFGCELVSDFISDELCTDNVDDTWVHQKRLNVLLDFKSLICPFTTTFAGRTVEEWNIGQGKYEYLQTLNFDDCEELSEFVALTSCCYYGTNIDTFGDDGLLRFPIFQNGCEGVADYIALGLCIDFIEDYNREYKYKDIQRYIQSELCTEPTDDPTTNPTTSALPSALPLPSSSPSLLLFAGLTYAEWKDFDRDQAENYLNTLTSDDCVGVIEFIALEDCCAPYSSKLGCLLVSGFISDELCTNNIDDIKVDRKRFYKLLDFKSLTCPFTTTFAGRTVEEWNKESDTYEYLETLNIDDCEELSEFVALTSCCYYGTNIDTFGNDGLLRFPIFQNGCEGVADYIALGYCIEFVEDYNWETDSNVIQGYIKSDLLCTEPTDDPTTNPTTSALPSALPSVNPSVSPSFSFSASPSASPSIKPSVSPSASPSTRPTSSPRTLPSVFPSTSPSASPFASPSSDPSVSPSSFPSARPSASPSDFPSAFPSSFPTTNPSGEPSEEPSKKPSQEPSKEPTQEPTQTPSLSPTPRPTSRPTPRPTPQPTPRPTPQPTPQPSACHAKGVKCRTNLLLNKFDECKNCCSGKNIIDDGWTWDDWHCL